MIVRHLESVFCDDVRRETGNKLSFMGIYAADMIVESFPTHIGRICVVATAITPKEKPFDKLIIKVQLGESTIAESEDMGYAIKDAMIKTPNDSSAIVARVILNLHGIPISERCKIRVCAETEEGEIRAPALVIKAASVSPHSPEPLDSSSIPPKLKKASLKRRPRTR